VRHLLNGSVIATSSYHGGRAMSFLLSGWKVAPLLRIMSGSSINVTTGVDNSLTGVNLDRPNLVDATQVYKNGYHFSDPQHVYLNANAFSPNALGTFGNVQRNAFKGPGYFDLDASAGRIFQLPERWSLEFRMDAFNVLNHVNFNNPSPTSILSSTFGRITGAHPNRVLQFSGKFRF